MSESSPPVADPQPERVDVTCDSWDEFEKAFRHRLQTHQLFVPSAQPPPVGSQLEFRFSIPDGTSISVTGRVVSSFPPSSPSEPSSAERAGMIVEFGKFARAEEQRVRALLASLEEQDRLGAFAPEVPSVPPVRAPSTPTRSPSTPTHSPSTPTDSVAPAHARRARERRRPAGARRRSQRR